MNREDKNYRRWLKQRNECCVPGCDNKDIHAHHWQTKTNHGVGIKTDDTDCIPLCHDHHKGKNQIHDTGKVTWSIRHLNIKPDCGSWDDCDFKTTGCSDKWLCETQIKEKADMWAEIVSGRLVKKYLFVVLAELDEAKADIETANAYFNDLTERREHE